MTNAQIAAYLKAHCLGIENAKNSAELERILGLSASELRRRINRLRRGSVPICSCRDGYFYARTAEEVCGTICQLVEMKWGIEADIQGLSSSLNRFREAVG